MDKIKLENKLSIRHLALMASLILFLGSTSMMKGQTYFTAFGLRAGTELGFTLQQKIWSTGTLEAIVTTNKTRWQCQGIVQYHKRFIGRRFNTYMGIGPHYGEVMEGSSFAGITPIIGFEVTAFGLNFSYDYKPSFNIFHGEDFLYHDSALSIRMVLIKEKKNRIFSKLFN
jgi:hypothetical protein